MTDLAIRRWVRGEHLSVRFEGDEWEPDADESFKAAVAGLPHYSGSLWRGTSLSRSDADGLAPGRVLHQSGSRSWTANYDLAADWAVRRRPDGRVAAVLSLRRSPTARDLRKVNPLQQEVIVPAGARFAVVSVRDLTAYLEIAVRQGAVNRAQGGRRRP